MKSIITKSALSILAVLLAISVMVMIVTNPAKFGEYPLFVRACALNLAIFASLIAPYIFCSSLFQIEAKYLRLTILLSLIPAFVFYLLIVPLRAVDDLHLEQQDSSLLIDRSSNGIIEIGFQYPIFTPTISLVNRDSFTREVTIFLRIMDRNQKSTLFRAVRARTEDGRLTVESTVRGMLSNNFRYLFNPVKLPPGKRISGKLVFIITNLEDGASFTEALSNGYTGYFELRDPDGGDLLADFPLKPI